MYEYFFFGLNSANWLNDVRLMLDIVGEGSVAVITKMGN